MNGEQKYFDLIIPNTTPVNLSALRSLYPKIVLKREEIKRQHLEKLKK